MAESVVMGDGSVCSQEMNGKFWDHSHRSSSSSSFLTSKVASDSSIQRYFDVRVAGAYVQSVPQDSVVYLRGSPGFAKTLRHFVS